MGRTPDDRNSRRRPDAGGSGLALARRRRCPWACLACRIRSGASSATYDEVAYLVSPPDGGEPASRTRSPGWARRSRSGSCSRRRCSGLLDRLGQGELIDDPIRPSGRAPAAGPGRGALDLAGGVGALCLVEPAALRPQGDGAGRLALRPQPQPDRPRRTGHDGDAARWPAPRACSCSSGPSWRAAGGAGSGRPRRWAGWRFRASITAVLMPPILAVVWWCDGMAQPAMRRAASGAPAASSGDGCLRRCDDAGESR